MKDKSISPKSAGHGEVKSSMDTAGKKRRYSLAELLEGADLTVGLNTQTEWAREGVSVGREV